jgi:hypothetical protein
MMVKVRLHTRITDESDSETTARIYKDIRLPFIPFEGLCLIGVSKARGLLCLSHLIYDMSNKRFDFDANAGTFEHQNQREKRNLLNALRKEGWVLEKETK